jgi:subtilisin family serine protease
MDDTVDDSDDIRKDDIFPSTTHEQVSEAIIQTVNAGADIINLSLGLSPSSLVTYRILLEAYDFMLVNTVQYISASGNQGNIGSISLIRHKWIIPVAACSEYGQLHPMSNFGASIRYRGLMAPGINIISAASGGGYMKTSSTSFAAPFVTGTVALLWSTFPKATPTEIIHAIRLTASIRSHRSVIPPLLNAEAAWDYLSENRM